jgi:hypothetical protein
MLTIGGEFQAGSNIGFRQFWKVVDDLSVRHASR